MVEVFGWYTPNVVGYDDVSRTRLVVEVRRRVLIVQGDRYLKGNVDTCIC